MLNDFFIKLTGYELYDYQTNVVAQLLGGDNVCLCAPTGAGKTWAALLPFLYAKTQGVKFADRLIYVLPLRTLATSLYKDTVMACSSIFAVKKSPDERAGEEDELIITIQTGEQKDDPFFEGDIIFTTVDQCLSAYLNCPVSLPQRLGNINAGALLGSFVVIDEFHLLEPGKSMDTAIEMLAMLKPFSRFVIMTATLATKSMTDLKELLGGVFIQLKSDDVVALPSHKNKKRTYRWINRPLSSTDVLDNHLGKRSIVILNTVTRAQRIFLELRKSPQLKDTKLLLLHSRYYSEDRKKIEDELMECFGKNAVINDVILVTTQVVEAGMDISADMLHTELAPLNSVVQRAGRCARYSGDRGVGTVFIYDLEVTERGPVLGPYRDNDQKSLIESTRAILEQLPTNGMVLDFTAELERLDEVHSFHEAKYLASYRQNQTGLRNKIHEAMDGRNEGAVRQLIRDIASVNVIICHDRYSLAFDKNKWPRLLSVPRTSIFNITPFLEDASYSGETVAWYPVEDSNIIDDDSDLTFCWMPVTSSRDISSLSWLIVINPEFASYTAELGLQIGVKGDYVAPKYFDRPLIKRYAISYETYREHAQKTLESYRSMTALYRIASGRLTTHFGVSPDLIETMAEACCVLHDVGKLSIKWQEAVRKWQQHKSHLKLSEEPLAHSDYDPETDFEKKREFPMQPPHAAEGAYAVGAWLKQHFGEYAIAVWTAIARHHGAFTEALGDFTLSALAEKCINKTLPPSFDKIVVTDRPDILIRNNFRDDLLSFSTNNEDALIWPLYAFIARRLRLADQKSQKGELK